METRRDVFQAIADPTRRLIIGLLAKAPLNLNAITEHFELTRPAISNHIKILQECGVIEVEQIGRERYCKIQADHLKIVADWIAQYTELWTGKLDSFAAYLDQINPKTHKNDNIK
jgi:DNA-binding transcriptional ArsR family regulator